MCEGLFSHIPVLRSKQSTSTCLRRLKLSERMADDAQASESQSEWSADSLATRLGTSVAEVGVAKVIAEAIQSVFQ